MEQILQDQLASLKILLVSDSPITNSRIRAGLSDESKFCIEWVRRLPEAIARIRKSEAQVVLFEPYLPGIEVNDAVSQMFGASPQAPVIILDDGDHPDLVSKSARLGARDFLSTEHIDAYSLTQILKYVLERQSVEDALFFEKERASVTLNSIGDAVLCTDLNGKVTYLNATAESMTGWDREQASGKPLGEVFKIIDGTTREPARDPMKMAVELNKTVGLTLDCLLVRRDGSESAIEDSAAPIHDKAGVIVGAVIVFHDVSSARAAAREMTHSAQHDVLTNLPNRMLLNDRLVQALSLAERQKRLIAVAFLDLDGFKYVNDSLGHATGDRLLQSVSQRLQAGLRACDTISRQGGDEFVILLPGLIGPEDAAASAKKLINLLNAPHLIGDQNLHINGSIGISLYPADGTDGETLIKNADTAMYCAKESGRNNFQFYKPAMNAKSVERQSLESALRYAVERGELCLNYQPKVSLATGKTMGVEALLRWHHPEHGLIPPSRFIPVAEDSGLISAIGKWVLTAACRQARAWQLSGIEPLPIAVNVSALEFRDCVYVEKVKKILSETGLQPEFLEMELTEGVLMEHPGPTVSALQRLKGLGVSIAVDDFGTGHSSLSYLRQFPIDTLKIDRSFISQITENTGDSKIISAIIGMAKSLGYLVVAEGIETREQKAYLQGQGCAQGQGYLFSRPLSANQFSDYLRTAAV
jgi:diguanylate cyclase (GGDEF)-like protein/PAS domain S-box-containing protein